METFVAPRVPAELRPPFAASTPPALPLQVIKRDGRHAPFDLAKIASAIARAGAATGEFDAAEANELAQAVGRVLAHRHTGSDERVPDIETIQDCVEHSLAAAGWFHTARAYIVYRDRHERLRADRKTLVDVAASVDEYLDQKDWREFLAGKLTQPRSRCSRVQRQTVESPASNWLAVAAWSPPCPDW